ncbi:MAG TPA: L,D-transpeptidase [Solirubrobacteraceae bacterium]|nr:L,D-transpeptidase [Solirubrobacteraceae bacterium]
MRRIAPLIGTVAVLVFAPGAAAKAPTPPTHSPAAKLTLATPSLFRVGGHPVALARQTWTLVASVSTFVSGEAVQFTFTRNGHVLKRVTVPFGRGRGGTGRASTGFRLANAGRVRVTATHAATAAQSGMSANARIDVIQPSAGFGSGGLRVQYLQRRLRGEGYAVHLSGRYDDQTGRAVIAYRKVNRMARGGSAVPHVYRLLAVGRGSFHAKYPGHGRHMEADLSRQVLALLNPHGQPAFVYHISSGKPSTPTILGSYYVYSKTPGYNSLGMLDSNYFIEGYAVHGYHDVPLFAASHGCIRTPIPDAASIYGWVYYGTRIDVYP